MNDQCKKDEKVLRDIIKKHVSSVYSTNQIRLNIYYKNPKTKNYLMKNDLWSNRSELNNNYNNNNKNNNKVY